MVARKHAEPSIDIYDIIQRLVLGCEHLFVQLGVEILEMNKNVTPARSCFIPVSFGRPLDWGIRETILSGSVTPWMP